MAEAAGPEDYEGSEDANSGDAGQAQKKSSGRGARTDTPRPSPQDLDAREEARMTRARKPMGPTTAAPVAEPREQAPQEDVPEATLDEG